MYTVTSHLLKSTQEYPFKVKATSPAEACEIVAKHMGMSATDFEAKESR